MIASQPKKLLSEHLPARQTMKIILWEYFLPFALEIKSCYPIKRINAKCNSMKLDLPMISR